ncbi:hypothetical protein D3C71_22410 [compost metagenome]
MHKATRLLFAASFSLGLLGAAHAAGEEPLPPPIPASATPLSAATVPPVTPENFPALPPAPLLPPTLPLPPGSDGAETKPVEAPAAARPAAPVKRTFLSRSELEAQRRDCDITTSASLEIKVGHQAADVPLTYAVKNGEKCLAAAASDTDWADVVRADGSRTTVRIAENTTDAAREANVRVVARNGKSVTFVLTQSAAGKPAAKPTKRSTEGASQ